MTCYIWIATNVKTNHIKEALMDRCQVCLISEAKFEHNPKDVTFWCHKSSTHTSTKLLANANSFVLALEGILMSNIKVKFSYYQIIYKITKHL